MKTIICGSRWINNYFLIDVSIQAAEKEKGIKITEIVTGGCSGIDQLAENYAKEHGIRLSIFPANWSKYDLSAGAIRDQQMVDYADALIAIWDSQSRGTQITINMAMKKGIPVYIRLYGKTEEDP